ncbi:hypothetical protein BaRGS_00005237 [Batillaria attramentaria]|uniref:Uncharacterized protein n=1 Tax=Batillaria attramentaria TaxID=370345 RepID=A0ABD0LX64_9CAEN
MPGRRVIAAAGGDVGEVGVITFSTPGHLTAAELASFMSAADQTLCRAGGRTGANKDACTRSDIFACLQTPAGRHCTRRTPRDGEACVDSTTVFIRAVRGRNTQRLLRRISDVYQSVTSWLNCS